MFLIIAYSNAQSKKEQIVDLNYKIDSLTLIAQSNKEKIILLNFKIDSLNIDPCFLLIYFDGITSQYKTC